MHRVLSQTRTVTFQFQFLATRLATDNIIVIACLITHEVYCFRFLLASFSRHDLSFTSNITAKFGNLLIDIYPACCKLKQPEKILTKIIIAS